MISELDRIRSQMFALGIRSGDDKAFSDLVSLWERPLFYYIRKLSKSEEDAWDILQETWIRIFRWIGKVSDLASLPAWLYTTARNAAFNYNRDKRKIDDLLSGEVDVEAARPGEDYDFSRADARAIHRGLGQLPGRQRDVLVLHFLEKRDPALEERFQKEMKKMTENRLSPAGCVVWTVTIVGAAAMAVFFTWLAITIDGLPWLGRAGLVEGTIFSIAWIILGVRTLKKGSFNLFKHENAIHGLTFGFVLLLLINMLILGGQLEDRTLGNQMMITGGIFFMLFGIPAIINMRFNRTELTLRQHLLKIELKVAELSERVGE